MHPAAAVLIHSVLLPERFSGHAAFHLRYPVSRDSPEPHPLIVLSAWRTPESFTPSADLRRFPISFHCRYSVMMIGASYHTFLPLSTTSFSCKQGRFLHFHRQFVLFSHNSSSFCQNQCSFTGGQMYFYTPCRPAVPLSRRKISGFFRHAAIFRGFSGQKGRLSPFSPPGPLPFVRRRSTISSL